jgi:ribosomal protein L7/L12
MNFLFGKSLSPERFEELNKHVLRREELIYQIRVGNRVRALQIFGEDTGASFKEVKAAVSILEKEVRQLPALSEEELATSPFAVRNLLIKGNKSEAVRLYSQQTGVDLPEATKAVERLQIDLLKDPNFLRPLLRGGHKVEAVRHYSEMTGVSLGEAQEVVDQLEQQMQRGA